MCSRTLKEKFKDSNLTAVIQTPLGKLGIISSCFLERFEFLKEDILIQISEDRFVQQIVSEVNQYFDNPNFQFTIPYQVTGTIFQKQVWSALSSLSVGETITYSALAKKLTTGARAIGNACRMNPLPLLIPCHRVLAKRGLGGFDGDLIGRKVAIKQWLLKHEQNNLPSINDKLF